MKMQFMRSRFVAVFFIVIVVICCCHCDGISQDKIQFGLLPNQQNTFVDQLSESLNGATNFWGREAGQQTIKQVGTAVAKMTGIPELLKAVPVLQLITGQGNDWKTEISNLIPDKVEQEIVENDIADILNSIDTQQYGLTQLGDARLSDAEKRPMIDSISTVLFEIVDRFRYGGSRLRRYPALVAPILISLASFVANLQPMMTILDPALARAWKVPCYLAETISNYFLPTLFERLNQIIVDAKFSFDDTPKQAKYEEETFKAPFYPYGYEIEQEVRCEPVGKETENENEHEFLIVRDGLNEIDDYRDVITGDCARDYFRLVRNKLEILFGHAFNLANFTCNNKIRKAANPTTGNGWLSIRFGEFKGRMPDNGTCDLIGFCDPYVRIYFNDEKSHRWQSKTQIDVKRWTTYNETYYSDRISKNTKIIIEIFDKNSGKNNDKSMLKIPTTIKNLLTTPTIVGPNAKILKLFLYSFWIDEYENSK